MHFHHIIFPLSCQIQFYQLMFVPHTVGPEEILPETVSINILSVPPIEYRPLCRKTNMQNSSWGFTNCCWLLLITDGYWWLASKALSQSVQENPCTIFNHQILGKEQKNLMCTNTPIRLLTGLILFLLSKTDVTGSSILRILHKTLVNWVHLSF